MTLAPVRDFVMAAALAAAISVTTAHTAQWTDLLPAGTGEEALRGYVRTPAALSPAATAGQPLSLTGAGAVTLVRTQWTLFQPAGWEREGRTVGRVSVGTELLDVVAPVGHGGNWWAGWSHRDLEVDAFLSRPSYDAAADGDVGGDSWALGYRGTGGWRAGLGWGSADGGTAARWVDDGGQVVDGADWTAREVLRTGLARETERWGWSLEWERAHVADTVAFARYGSEMYSLGLVGDENAYSVSAWQLECGRRTWVQIQRTRSTTSGPLAVAGWQRGSAWGIDDRWAVSVGRHMSWGAGKETWLSLEWVDSDRDMRGVAVGGLLPGLGDRGRGVAAIGGRGLAAKYAHRRPLSGSLGLVTGLGLAHTSSGNSYLLEEASGLLGSFHPTHRRWYGADLTALGLTVGLDRNTPDARLGLAATWYLGLFDSHSGSIDYPIVPPGPPGPPGPPVASTRFDKAFHLTLAWERQF